MQILLYLLKLVKQTKEPDKIAVQETNTISEGHSVHFNPILGY